ncbi:hypothetical protein GALL_90400 [mine drainage metagenome]|uniref:DUF1365 domain-containing protein n=1 Tax=mine drainage metagenome TaxID=410659 RepID=A0A1J5SJN3_9ZZZZ
MNSPQLCFGSVHHSRLRPARNNFNYGVFFLRLPLRSMEGRTMPTALLSRNRFNLLSFHDRDHGDGKQALLPWIDNILKLEGIADADGEMWLQTFPRVLGYVFNPVSFWFCHRRDGALRAVLCEVSNTFGERHCYLLDRHAPIADGEILTARKVFHVSPFCRVEGSYRFQFKRNQRISGEITLARIDYHDADGPLLLTSITGSSRPLSDRTIVHALARFPLMTFMVIARIHWQALRLWLKRVPFHRKPSLPLKELSK